MTCVSCSQPLAEGARFCSFCGHEVRLNAVEERRVVTVLFADLVGYTALAEHLDPEPVKRLVDGAFDRMIDEIERFGGHVDKVLGDGILAIFGAPVAHEDDPDRAVRSAIAMHATIDDYVAVEVGIEQQRLQLRIGINTGEVVVGRQSGTDDYTAMGDVVNVASRLQTMAPPGGTYLGASTEAQLSPLVERVLVAETEVRGREQTEQIWQVRGMRSQFTASRSRHDRPFVGRATQRELFASVMGLVAGGRSAIVSVTGEAGSGKTRLVTESLARFPHPDVVVFSGVCAPYGETNVWAPIASALLRLLGADHTVPAGRLRELVEENGLALYGFDESDPRLQRFIEGAMHIFGHPSELDRVAPGQAREILMQVVVEGVHRRSLGGPIVVWIDDLQWADPLLLELLARLTRSLADRPVLVVTAQRDDAEQDWPPAHDHPVTIRMPLDPLSREESDELVQRILGSGADTDLMDQLFERSGGNPLFLTQLAEVSRDHPGQEALPGSLRALIAARLDALPAGQRQIVDNASVLGATGALKNLESFAAAMGQPFEPADIDQLVENGIFDLEEHWWRFRSDVMREVAYQTLTKTARAQRHAGTAVVMRGFDLDPIDQIAHHAATAAELVEEIGAIPGVAADIADQAVDLLTTASRRALDVGGFAQAIRQTTRALDLVDLSTDAAKERELRLIRAKACVERRDASTGEVDAQQVLQSATADGDVRQEAIARRLLGLIAQQQGDLPRARQQLTASVDLLRTLGPDPELVTSLSDRGFVEVFGGSLEEADRLLAEAESMAAGSDDRRRLAWIRQHQAWVAFLSGDTDLADERLAVASGLFDDLGDRSGSSWALGLLAYVRFFERRFADAESLATTVRREALEVGELWAPAMMDSLMASIRLWSGRFSEAEELSRRALVGFRQLNDRFGTVQALAPRMRALVALGRNQEAEKSLEEALSLADSFGDLAIPTMAAAGTAAHLGLGQRAVTLSEVALTRMLAMHADGSEARITLALGLCQVGDPDRALATLLEVRAPSPYSQAVTALASAIAGMPDETLAAAASVHDDETSTYLDRVLADIAAGSVLVGQDESAGDARLDSAVRSASRAGDAAAVALATAARSEIGSHGDRRTVQHLGDGWKRVVTDLAAKGKRVMTT
ncbi:ATP-binding protein [Ilumatobacter nonamiensis]|uniref:ATP-binding protein n=1 Tax=Ilumatobacter nonamiensis TaxID=467093 RepID=UPI00130EFC37|nr:adenylate/guanylate cyclase domain-containing protein [Ilumatobacter nonamiensis]